MESVEILVNGFIVRNGRTKNGLRKDCIIEEIKSSTIPLIYKKSLLYYVEKANDERKDIEEMLKKYMKEFNISHGQAKRVAMFEKVSFEQFYKDYMNCLSDAEKESITEETIKDICEDMFDGNISIAPYKNKDKRKCWIRLLCSSGYDNQTWQYNVHSYRN